MVIDSYIVAKNIILSQNNFLNIPHGLEVLNLIKFDKKVFHNLGINPLPIFASSSVFNNLLY